MEKEVFITKMPVGVSLSKIVDDLAALGYDTRTKEEVDTRLIDIGVDDIRGTYFRITVEEIE